MLIVLGESQAKLGNTAEARISLKAAIDSLDEAERRDPGSVATEAKDRLRDALDRL